jgi:uncharacterized protein YxjI
LSTETERDGHQIAEVSKWFRARDTYGVEVRDPQETVLILVSMWRWTRAASDDAGSGQ